jgi:hypothetical protein
MQIGTKVIEILLVTMMLKKKPFKKTKIPQDTFPSLFA